MRPFRHRPPCAYNARMNDDVENPPRPADAVRPVRTAWIAGPRTFGLIGRVLKPLALGLMDEVVESFAFCPSPGEEPEPDLLPAHRVPFATARWWWPWDRPAEHLRGELSKRKIQVLHALDASAAPLACELGGELSLPVFVNSFADGDGGCLAEVARDAVGILAGSEPIRAALASRGIWSEDRLHLMRPGVYHVRRPTCFGDPQHSVAVVCGGDFDRPEPFLTVLETFAEIARRSYDCSFFLVGSGPAERQLRRAADRLGIRTLLTFADVHPTGQLTGIFKAADLYISPRPLGSIDMRSLLAMAAGLPVLAAAPGDGVNDFLIDGETAAGYTPGAAGELTAALADLLEDRARARSLAEGGLEHVHACHSPAVNVSALAHFYRRALAG